MQSSEEKGQTPKNNEPDRSLIQPTMANALETIITSGLQTMVKNGILKTIFQNGIFPLEKDVNDENNTSGSSKLKPSEVLESESVS